MLAAMDVARYFLFLASEEEGELVSNMKLQKLVYYAQGFCLAITGSPLFAEDVQAWIHGPVVPSLYHAFKGYANGTIPPPEEIDLSIYPAEVLAILNDVYAVYGQYSASGLRALTHSDPPWKYAIPGSVITQAALRDYFATQLADA